MIGYTFQISNSIFGLRFETRPKTRPNWRCCAETGWFRISANNQSHAAVKALLVIICTDLSKGGLILVVEAVFSNPRTSWSQMYSSKLFSFVNERTNGEHSNPHSALPTGPFPGLCRAHQNIFQDQRKLGASTLKRKDTRLCWDILSSSHRSSRAPMTQR